MYLGETLGRGVVFVGQPPLQPRHTQPSKIRHKKSGPEKSVWHFEPRGHQGFRGWVKTFISRSEHWILYHVKWGIN